MRSLFLGLALLLGTFFLGPEASAAQLDSGPDKVEPGSIEAIAELTSDPSFGSPWVSYVPDSETVPSPTDYLGHVVGAAGELSRTDSIYGYLRALAAASERVQVETIGRTEEGREILLVVIADEEGIEKLPALRAATASLADPRKTDPETAEKILASARPIYYLNAALHGDETGSSEMVMELAYRLAVSEQPMIRRIRERLVVLINPVSNPDGRDKMADWFYRHLEGKTEYDSLPRQSPPYWGRYVFVDANRDAHQQTQELTRAVFRMFFDYHPTVIHDYHEAIAFLQTWNGTGPYNPHLEPVTVSEVLEMSFHEVTALTGLGMPGVWTWDFGEGFGLHYLDSIAMNHNAIGRGYETYGNATAETMDRTLDPSETKRRWFRPLPAKGPVRWSMRDGVNYMQSATLAILDWSALHAPELLRNFYRKGYSSWQQGVTGSPFAFVIPADQADRRRVTQMIDVLLRQRIEVARAATSFTVEEGSFPAGSFVVRLDQPYRNYAVDLLLPQEFPADAEHQPYDDASWSLPLHYGVETLRVDDEGIGNVPLEPIEAPVGVEPGRVSGPGPVYLLRERGQEALLAARYRLAGFSVEIAAASFRAGEAEYPPGSWILPSQNGLRLALDDVAQELGLDFEGVDSAPEATSHQAPPPRLGIWVPWADTDSIGWLRYTLDQQGIPYTYLRDEEIRAGHLRDEVDVIVYGHVDLELQGQIHGIEPAAAPLAFTATPEYPSHGVPASSEDIAGGPGWKGLAHLEQFVAEGGVLITLGKGSTLALDGGLVRNVRRSNEAIQTPGVEIVASFLRPEHPLHYGYPSDISVYRSNLPVYDLPRRWLRMAYCTSCLDGPVDPRWVVLQWGRKAEDGAPSSDPSEMVLSGGAQGQEKLVGRPAILAVPRGKGFVIAYNFNPIHRDLNHSDYRLLWNGILNWSHLDLSASGTR